ncbi:MAG: hypothetical protein ACI8PZ_002233 [Myxococcota bacterium]|jgi:hypothetical protein
MHGIRLSLVLAPLALACAGGDDGSGPANGSDDTPPVGTATGGSTGGGGTGGGGTTGPAISGFTAGGYLLDHLAIVAEHDTDGDGVIDNNLPLVLNLVNVVMGTSEYSVEAVNAIIADSLYPDNIMLVDARNANNRLDLDLLLGLDDGSGLTVDPASYDGDGMSVNRLAGAFTDEIQFTASADAISLPVVLFDGIEPVPLILEAVTLSGDLDADGLDTFLLGAIPVQAVIDDMVEPLIPDEGVDIDGDGVPESKEEVLDLVWSIAPAAGDVDLGGGLTGVSTLLEFRASSAEF